MFAMHKLIQQATIPLAALIGGACRASRGPAESLP
jgi:hypothetical protein